MLNKRIKRFIKESIYETNILELKRLVQIHGSDAMDKACKILSRIRLNKGLVIKKIYPNYTSYYTKNRYFNEKNYSFENGFYCDYRLNK